MLELDSKVRVLQRRLLQTQAIFASIVLVVLLTGATIHREKSDVAPDANANGIQEKTSDTATVFTAQTNGEFPKRIHGNTLVLADHIKKDGAYVIISGSTSSPEKAHYCGIAIVTRTNERFWGQMIFSDNENTGNGKNWSNTSFHKDMALGKMTISTSGNYGQRWLIMRISK